MLVTLIEFWTSFSMALVLGNKESLGTEASLLKDRTRNEYIRTSIVVDGVTDTTRNKMREHRLQWFGHVTRRGEKDLVRVILWLRVEGRRGRSEPKLTSDQAVKIWLCVERVLIGT